MQNVRLSRPVGRKVYVEGRRSTVRVPAREIPLQPPNPPVRLYDTSGPYGDSEFEADVNRGLPPLRERWIEARGDVTQLPGPSAGASRTGFPAARRPRRARTGSWA